MWCMEENRSGDCRFERSTERQSDRRTGIPPCFFVSVRSKGVANAFHERAIIYLTQSLGASILNLVRKGNVRECNRLYGS